MARGPTATNAFVLPGSGRALDVVSADGTRLNAAVFGAERASTIVMAHGYTQQMRMWAGQVDDLAERFRIVVYDQRGHGGSDRPPLTGYTVEALGDDLAAVLRAALPPGERAVVVGHSMGGIGVMSMAQRRPEIVDELVSAAVLVNTAPNRIPDFVAVARRAPARVRPVGPRLVRDQLLAIVSSRARRPLRWLVLGDDPRAEHVDAIVEMLAELPGPTMREFMSAFLTMDVLDGVRRLTVPTVVIGGTRDRLLPAVHCHLIAETLPKLAKLVLVTGCGHMGPWEARAIVSGEIDAIAGRATGCIAG